MCREQTDARQQFPLGPNVNCHSLILSLQRLLQALPGGLIEAAICPAVALAFSTRATDEAAAQELACLLQQQCSPSKLALLNMLLIHWRKVVANEPTNKMNAQTMATCCFMAVFTAAGETEDQAEMMKHFKLSIERRTRS